MSPSGPLAARHRSNQRVGDQSQGNQDETERAQHSFPAAHSECDQQGEKSEQAFELGRHSKPDLSKNGHHRAVNQVASFCIDS